MDIYSSFATRFEKTREHELSLEEYLADCKRQSRGLCHSWRTHVTAIGEPNQIDTRNDPRMSRMFANKVIKVYPAFPEFYGMETRSSRWSRTSGTGAGARRKRSRSCICWARWAAEELDRRTAEDTDGTGAVLRDQGSPVNESPLGLFDTRRTAGSSKSSTASHAAISTAS